MTPEDHRAITTDWEATNARRHTLIEQKRVRALTDDEAIELANLKRLARIKSALVMPLPLDKLKAQEDDLKRRRLWRGE